MADRPALFKLAPDTVLPEETTLLPVLDLREYPEDFEKPDLAEGTTLFVPADYMIEQGKKVWRDEGFLQMVRPYRGPLPNRSTFEWEEFPLFGLHTDLGMGLEINRHSVKKVSYNALLPVHAVLDASVMPLYALGVLATDGHLDLAGRVLPSATVKSTLWVDLNLVSLRGGGRFFSKAYVINLSDRAVSDSKLYPRAQKTREDGQAFGQSRNTELIQAVFGRIARDPELAMISHLADMAWLGRILEDPSIEADVKHRALVRLTEGIHVPELTAEELKIVSDPYLTFDEKIHDITAGRNFDLPEYRLREDQVMDPDWIESLQGRLRLFNLTFQVVLKHVGRLKAEARHRPLLVEEVKIKNKIMSLLVRWGQAYVPNRIYRRVIQNKAADLFQKKALIQVLAESPGIFENDRYIGAVVNGLYETIAVCDEKSSVEAATLLVAAKGEMVLGDDRVSPRLLLKALSGEEPWAGSWVLKGLKPDRYQADILRLAGAMGLEEAVPILLESMKAGERQIMIKAGEMIPRPVVDLLPTKAPAYVDVQPKPVLAAGILGNYSGHPEVVKALRTVVDHFTPDDPEELPAEAARSLGRLHDTESADMLLRIWMDDWRLEDKAPLMRRAVLEALTEMGAYDSLMIALGQALELAVVERGPKEILNQKRTALLEIVECFENLRLAAAIGFMTDVIQYFPESVTLRRAAFETLARTPVPKAEAALRKLAQSKKSPISQEAKKALNRLVMEKAKLCYLKGYMTPEKAAVRLQNYCW